MARISGRAAHALSTLGWRTTLLPLAALVAIAAGAVLRIWPQTFPWSGRVWFAGLVLTGAPVVWRTVRGIFAGRFAADLVAMLAIVTAVVLRDPLPGLIVVLMQTGGEALERYAAGKASEAVRELEAAAPRIAHRRRDDHVDDVAVDEVRVGDVLLVRPGELVPCDCAVLDGRSHVDTSRLTGEPVPVRAETGTSLMSGSTNGEGLLVVRATALSRESQYARIVELVRQAQASKAPLQRLADRYAVWFTPFTLAVALGAYLISGNPERVLAVLVVATPCPLILATPVAVIGGINRAARRQVIVRNGTSLEQLASVKVAVFDKTGTLTVGLPEVSRVVPAAGFSPGETLRLAGAVEQGSGHLLARTLVDAARRAGVLLSPADEVVESPGRGVTGRVGSQRVTVGSRAFVLEVNPGIGGELPEPESGEGLHAYVAVDGRACGRVDYADRLRPGLDHFFADLQALGIRRTLLLSGDDLEHARAVADVLGIREVRGDLLPEDKVRIVRELVDGGDSVVMVGDGTNDAPALSSATVGIALAGHGGGITAEAAGVVVLVDDLTRVVDTIRISRRTLRIARQSIGVGLGLSGIAMGFAALGMIPPTVGALLQEAIDVAVILNALRASR